MNTTVFVTGYSPARRAAVAIVRGTDRASQQVTALAVGVALLGVVLAPGSARADHISSPGKRAAAASTSQLDLKSIPQPSLQVQLVKGKKKNLLMVTGVVAVYMGPPAGILVAGINVNGVTIEPYDIPSDSRLISQNCTGFCTLAGTWWLDLDAAEQSYPGMFVNAPLTVTLTSYATGASADGAKMSVTAMLVKK